MDEISKFITQFQRANTWLVSGFVMILAFAFTGACLNQPQSEPAVDYGATVAAVIAEAEAAATPDVQATVRAGVEATNLASIPTPPKPEATASEGEPTPSTRIVVTATPTPIVTPTPTVPPTPTPPPFTELNFAGASYTTNKPNQIQVTFGLRNQDGRSIVVPARIVEENLSVFERDATHTTSEDLSGLAGNWEEIDYSETSYFVHAAENIDLEVVFVLDFTNSMYQARLPNGQNGTDAMLAAFDAAINVLSPTHRIGVVEFHDRNVDPRVLSRLTSNRDTIRKRIQEFTDSQFDNGSSRVWDAVVNGMSLFSDSPRTVRALVFLSDGRDTSSTNSLSIVETQAAAKKIQTYVLGIGDVSGGAQLQRLATTTNGDYYSVSDISELQTTLQIVVSDLSGQYQLSYITLRRTGQFQSALLLEIGGLKDALAVGPYRVDGFLGPDNVGIISVDPPSRNVSEGTTSYFVRARHMPRNIDTIRFKIDNHDSATVEFVPLVNGGLLDGWSLDQPDATGFYQATSPEPIEFGNFGLLFEITIPGTAQSGTRLGLEFDNSIYGESKELTIGPTSYLDFGRLDDDIPVVRSGDPKTQKPTCM